MRRLLITSTLVMAMLGSCSSSEPLAIDLAQPMEPPPVEISISGAAVDDGVVCSTGTFVRDRMEDMNGNVLDHEAWAAIFDAAVETGSVAEAKSFNEYECGDGSGTITINQHVSFDFAVLDIETFGDSPINSGTWTLEGTGDYESMSGSGDLVNDLAEGMIHAVGEVEA